jgi:cysteine-S-conjugate beta-lyase
MASPNDRRDFSIDNGTVKKTINLLGKQQNLPPSPAPSTPTSGRKYALATELVYTESTDQYNASSTPIYQVR